ncbi:MAG: hypothetical protein ABUT20_47000 [Bacteroidota bacterium]
MKIFFWISAITLILAWFFLFNGFVNVYFKNYNGGPQSSSGGIIYQVIGVLAIIIAGFSFYFAGKLKIATIIMGSPIILLALYLFVALILPYLKGERMN